MEQSSTTQELDCRTSQVAYCCSVCSENPVKEERKAKLNCTDGNGRLIINFRGFTVNVER